MISINFPRLFQFRNFIFKNGVVPICLTLPSIPATAQKTGDRIVVDQGGNLTLVGLAKNTVSKIDTQIGNVYKLGQFLTRELKLGDNYYHSITKCQVTLIGWVDRSHAFVKNSDQTVDFIDPQYLQQIAEQTTSNKKTKAYHACKAGGASLNSNIKVHNDYDPFGGPYKGYYQPATDMGLFNQESRSGEHPRDSNVNTSK